MSNAPQDEVSGCCRLRYAEFLREECLCYIHSFAQLLNDFFISGLLAGRRN
jgi:hypothetical protein